MRFRAQECEELSKLNTEDLEQIDRFFRILLLKKGSHPGILAKPDRIWNMDETAIDGIWGAREEVCSPVYSHAREHKASSVNKEAYKHVTVVFLFLSVV